MDTKALAKSKRAHSLHHSKKQHHHQASKAPSARADAASGSKKPTGKQTVDKPQQSHESRALPSNWDRYGEEFDLGSEDAAQQSTSQPSEFVEPKSKGADYAHLLAEAKAHSLSNYSSDNFPASSDFVDDFIQDFGPLLSVKGQSMLSWITDDTFEFEEKSSTSQEAAFLSLNLNTLAEQLAKAKPSKRLFIEPDLIPPELLDDELQACGEEKYDEIEIVTSAVAQDSGESSPGQNQERNEPMSYGISVTKELHIPISEDESKSLIQIQDEILQLSPDPISIRNVDPASEVPPTFEAASAEAELDMLLNSFGETTILDSSPTSAAAIPSTPAPSVETVNGDAHDQSSKTKLLDDFDSWLDTI